MKKILSYDSEVSLFSILLKNPNKVFDVLELKPFMFSSKPNQVLMESIFDLTDEGYVPEYNLIVATLKSKELINEVGGEETLKHIMSQQIDEANLQEFKNHIINAYKSRALLSVSSSIPSKLDEYHDPDLVIDELHNNLDSLQINNGGSDTVKLFSALKEFWTGLKSRLQNAESSGIPTGFKSLDAITGGYNPGDVLVIGARPSIGKSAWLVNSVHSLGFIGKPSLTFSLEMSKQKLVNRIIALDSGVPISDIKLGIVDQKKLDLIAESVARVKDYPIYIDTNFNCTLSYVVYTIKKYHKLYNIEVVFIDYLQLLSERSADATNEIGRIMRMLKLLANQLQITIVILSQLNRLVELRPDKRPILSDMRQSGDIEQDADIVIGLYRDDYYNRETKHKGIIENIILKNRDGATGTLMYTFNAETNYMGEK